MERPYQRKFTKILDMGNGRITENACENLRYIFDKAIEEFSGLQQCGLGSDAYEPDYTDLENMCRDIVCALLGPDFFDEMIELSKEAIKKRDMADEIVERCSFEKMRDSNDPERFIVNRFIVNNSKP